MSKKNKKPKELYDTAHIPGTIVIECESCDALSRQVKDLKKNLRALEKLAEWYDQGLGPNIASHRIREALKGNTP